MIRWGLKEYLLLLRREEIQILDFRTVYKIDLGLYFVMTDCQISSLVYVKS